MRKIIAAPVLSLCLLAAGAVHAAGMSLSSPEIKNKGTIAMEQVFKGFGCTGGNISPALAWKGAPKGTKSFALTVYDPDAPTGSGWWHWVMFNIPANVTSLPKNAGDPAANLAPPGSVQGRTDFGSPGYGGPCPPEGDKPHHYHFTVYALDIEKMDADQNASPAYIGYNIHFHTLAKGHLLGLFGREKTKEQAK
jgi:Raf kinase inhibitor-like YbhB/YbcL family protein